MAEFTGELYIEQPLVEVFYVSVDDIYGEKPGNLYGTITINYSHGSEIIYNRTRDDYESIYPGQNVLLIGPARAIFAYDSFSIDVDLKDKDAGLDPDDEVSRRQIGWNVYNTTNSYDEFISRKIDCQFGSVTVNYAVLSDAAVAKVEVTLIDGDGESPADVYGRIVALNGINESMLFRREKNERMDVRSGQLIPLSRSVVAVPLDGSLKVLVELYDYDNDDEIAKGIAVFPAGLSPPSENSISGKQGKIGVKVSWN